MTPFIIKEYGMKMGEPFIRIYPWGDWHFGNRGFCEKTFMRDRQRIIDDPLARVILMGDLAEFIARSDKRFEPKVIDQRFNVKDLDRAPDMCVDWICDQLEPIKEKIYGGVSSNHSDKVERNYHNDVHHKICKRLGIREWDYGAAGTIECYEGKRARRKQDLVAFIHHGFGGGRKRGAKVNRGDDLAGWFDADLFLMGHVHDRMKWHNTKLFATKKDGKPHIGHQDRMVVITGTYLRTYTEGCTGYGERAGYAPTSIGMHTVDVSWERFDNERVLVLK